MYGSNRAIRYQEFASSDRKLRLFAAACYRCEWALEDINSSSIVLETFEKYADGQAQPERLPKL